MGRLAPVNWEKIVCVFEQLGYRMAGQKGSHIKLEKPGVARPLIVPRYSEVGVTLLRPPPYDGDQPRCLLLSLEKLLKHESNSIHLLPISDSQISMRM